MRVRLDRIKLGCEVLKKEFTIDKLSDLSGVSKTTISGVKNGRSCNKETADKIASALGVELSELLEN